MVDWSLVLAFVLFLGILILGFVLIAYLPPLIMFAYYYLKYPELKDYPYFYEGLLAMTLRSSRRSLKEVLFGRSAAQKESDKEFKDELSAFLDGDKAARLDEKHSRIKKTKKAKIEKVKKERDKERMKVKPGVKEITDRQYQGYTRMKAIILPDSLRRIGEAAFQGCTNLESIVIPEGVSDIGESAFENCGNLAAITLPSGLTRISPGTFSGCSRLRKIALPGSLESLGQNAFSKCAGLEEAVIPEGIRHIDANCFLDCVNARVVVPLSQKMYLKPNAFAGCKSVAFIISDRVHQQQAAPQDIAFVGEERLRNLAEEFYENPENILAYPSLGQEDRRIAAMRILLGYICKSYAVLKSADTRINVHHRTLQIVYSYSEFCLDGGTYSDIDYRVEIIARRIDNDASNDDSAWMDVAPIPGLLDAYVISRSIT